MSKILNDQQCVKVSEFFKALSNPLRVRVLCNVMEEEKCVGDILQNVPARQANLSQQLGFLYMMGILKRRKQGKRVYYSLRDKRTKEFFERVRELVVD
jgi:ArsR family transcriptional regulator